MGAGGGKQRRLARMGDHVAGVHLDRELGPVLSQIGLELELGIAGPGDERAARMNQRAGDAVEVLRVDRRRRARIRVLAMVEALHTIPPPQPELKEVEL